MKKKILNPHLNLKLSKEYGNSLLKCILCIMICQILCIVSSYSQDIINEPSIVLTHPGGICFAAFSPIDDNLLATSTIQGDVYLWNLQTEEIIQIFPIENGIPSNVAFTSDGNKIAIGKIYIYGSNIWATPHITVWDVNTGVILQSINYEPDYPPLGFHQFAFSDDDNELIVSAMGYPGYFKTYVFNLEQGKELLSAHNSFIDFYHDGYVIYDDSSENFVKLYLTNSEKEITIPRKLGTGRILFHDQQFLLSHSPTWGSDHNSLYFIDILNGSIANQFSYPEPIYYMKLSRNEKILMTTGVKSGLIKLWDVENQEKLNELIHDVKYLAGTFSKSDKYLATFNQRVNENKTGTVYIWNISQLQQSNVSIFTSYQ